MENENIKENKVEMTKDHITFMCVVCRKFFDPGRNIVEKVGLEMSERNQGIEKYIDGIKYYYFDENEKCDKSESGKHKVITSIIANEVMDSIVFKYNENEIQMSKKESDEKTLSVKESQKEKEISNLQEKIGGLMSDITKLQESRNVIQTEKNGLVDSMEELKNRYKLFTGIDNIARWKELKKIEIEY